MARVPTKVLVLVGVLGLVNQTAVSVTDSEVKCLNVDGYCPAGKRLHSHFICVLCERGKTFLPGRNDCHSCLECAPCPEGYRKKENCTRTADTVCEIVPEDNVTTSPTTVRVTNSTQEDSTNQTTLAGGKGDTTEDPVPTKEPLKTDPGYKIGFYILLVVVIVLIVLFITFVVYHKCRKKQRERVIADLRSQVASLSLQMNAVRQDDNRDNEQDEPEQNDDEGAAEELLDAYGEANNNGHPEIEA